MKKQSKAKAKKQPKRSATSIGILKAKPAKQAEALQSFENRIAAGEKLSRSDLKIYHELEKRRDPETIHGGQSAAEYCGTSKRIISYHIGRGSLRQNPDGTFDKKELDRWLASRDRREKSPEAAKTMKDKDKAELRFRLARARREEMIVEQMKGNLAQWKEVETEWIARLHELKSSLYALSDRIAGLVVGKDRDQVHQIIRAEVRTILENYRRTGKYTPDVTT